MISLFLLRKKYLRFLIKNYWARVNNWWYISLPGVHALVV
ncbi:hypothetical protein LTSEURB_3738 [Salmonella enterica subsp. enterica serovar Urbana str. R8-2977]|uniref:Uncharacterized protein n=1 Tax=Salmonella enterica subsp. enterica serovar Urbana str. R8-2977 TaxID=913084 RepID=G5RYF1_SALET|nr:hypothetical protein LTSEURB_3738 [Salmonella enterica subsp. enterica serovar Urbana str. R8-2977]